MAAISYISAGSSSTVSASSHGLTSSQLVQFIKTTCVPPLPEGIAFSVSNVTTNTFTIDNSAYPIVTPADGLLSSGYTQRIFFMRPDDHASSVYSWNRNGGNNADTGYTYDSAVKDFAGITAAKTIIGDVIRVMASPYPELVDVSASFICGTSSIQLSQDIVQIVENPESISGINGWKGATRATCSTQTAWRKFGSNSIRITIGASPVANSLIAWKALPSTLDLSNFNKVSCWINTSAAFVSSSRYRLCLCSDLSGSVPEVSMHLEAAGTGAFYQTVFETDNASSASLPSNINSIAWYIGSSVPASGNYIQFDQIVACKSGSGALTFKSLVGKNTPEEPYWYRIARFETNSKLHIDLVNETLPTYAVRSAFSSETASLYKRECFKTNGAISSTSTNYTLLEGGSRRQPIIYDYGWNREDMMSKSSTFGEDMTFFDFNSGVGYGITLSQPDVSFKGKLGIVSCVYPIWLYCTLANTNGAEFYADDIYLISCENLTTTISSVNSPSNFTGNNLYWIACSDSLGGVSKYTIKNLYVISGGQSSKNTVTYSPSVSYIDNFIAINSDAGSFPTIYGNMIIGNMYTSSSNAASSKMEVYSGELRILNSTFLETTTFFRNLGYKDGKIIIHNENGSVDANKIYTSAGTISPDSSVKYKPYGYSWKASIISNTMCQEFPVKIQIAKVAIKAGRLFTAKLRCLRSSSNHSVILELEKNPIIGLDESIFSPIYSGYNWEQLSASFVPTNNGVVNINVAAWTLDSSGDVNIDDFVIETA